MYRFSSGAVFPRHRHHQEQITLIQEGEVEFSVGDEVRHLSAGGWLVVGSDVEHQIHAADGGAEVVAVVIPPRDDRDPYTVVEDGGDGEPGERVSAERAIQIFDGDAGPELPIVKGAGVARAVIWPGMQARARSLHRIQLDDGAATIDLGHPSDAVYYVIAGTGSGDRNRAAGAVRPPCRVDVPRRRRNPVCDLRRRRRT